MNDDERSHRPVKSGKLTQPHHYLAGSLPGFLLGGHLTNHVLHPEHQVAHEAEEAEEVGRVGEQVLAVLHVDLEVAPRVHHLSLAVLDLPSLVPGVGNQKLGGILLDSLNLRKIKASVQRTLRTWRQV